METIKSQLFKLCLEYIEKRISNVREALQNASESANDETKSSAGDKHETGRAMAQLEQEKAVKQLNEAFDQKNTLLKIDQSLTNKIAGTGAVIITNNGNFFIAIAAGKFLVNDQWFYAISSTSPIALKFKGLNIKGSFDFNNQHYIIEKIA